MQFAVNGAVISQFGLHTDTKITPEWTENKVRPTNNGGVVVARPIFGGYNVEVVFARVNGTGDDLAQFLEDNFKGGGNDPEVTLLETVRNADGSVNQYQYIHGILYPSDLGSFRGIEDVSQTMKAYFPERVNVGVAGASTVSGQVIPGLVNV